MRHHFIRFFALPAIATAIVSSSALAERSLAPAPTNHDARRDRLEGFTKDELARIEPYLARGPLSLIEFADMDKDELPAINIALRVRAPLSVVQALVTEPAGYPRFMPAIDAVKVIDRSGNAIVYDWSFDLALLRMQGRNTMTVYPASSARPDAGARITIDSDSGDLGRGRYLIRLLPHGAKETTLVLSMRLDLREANYLARQLAKAARSVNRSANLSLGFSMALHFQAEAERRAGAAAKPDLAAEISRPNFDTRALLSLLERGDLLLLETRGNRLHQLSVLAAVDQKRDKVHHAVRDAKAFGSALVPGGTANVVSEGGGVTTFDWNIDLPLVGVAGRMRMQDGPQLVAIDATQGALHGGQWRFELTALGKRATLVTGWARFDFEDSSWLIEKLVAADPFLGHGISAASEVMLVRALRSRATQR